MNDSTYTNACDPNSMIDQGGVRNLVYNIKLDGQPPVDSDTYSKALVPPESMNKSFYSFGGQHSNIGNQLGTSLNSDGSASQMIDNKFKDIKNLQIGTNLHQVYRPPITIMNDYTKNISSPMFTPGVYKTTSKLKRLQQNYVDFRVKSLKQKPKQFILNLSHKNDNHKAD